MAMHEQQDRLLDLLSRMGSAGRAEGEDETRFPRTFLPVPEHLRAFGPDVVLVVGPRGAGKTELFRAVVEQGLLPSIASRLPGVRLLPPEKTTWLPGYSSRGRGFPSEPQFRQFLGARTATDELFLEVWIAYLLRVLARELGQTQLEALFAPPGGDIEAVLGAYRENARVALLALDALDERLEREDRYFFVSYDELDQLARNDPYLTQSAVRGLVALWASHSRRWARLRGKIFLRTDLYERAATAGGADFSRLAANRAEISWSDRHLLAMLVRRLANSGDDLRDYCRKSRIVLEDGGDLGWFPNIQRIEEARPLVERMVGTYMGAGVKKGLTFRWVLDHVRDGRGQALPRPFVGLFETAADLQKASANRPRLPRLLEPQALRRALDKVSEKHVTDALDEWPWLERLKEHLRDLREVPWERRKIARHLDRLIESWDAGMARPAAENGRELVDYLVEVGIFRERPDERVDVPDLFLAGLGLKRKGGVKRQ